VAHVFFLLTWLYHFLQEIRTTIRSKLPSLYISVFLCCRKRRLERELQIESYRQKMRPYVQSIE